MKFKAKKRVILSDFEPFLTLKFAKKMFSRAILSCRAVAKVNRLFKQPIFFKGIGKKLWNRQTEPKLKFGLPEGVHKYVERLSLPIARKGLFF